ncbi:pre-B-cell leukemia transcription factor-interacting protein 1 isoform X2 [Silurus meridionalis]|uniref:Pre-B-cell leukemia transcription factor-interacting protein 1 n=1 Tax=Silurus meridionalis TaxID=175797 RepID=A0A8T0A3Z5_SILME|nr:pre-B-cell leukemia transcription factor-interacting protein 1 isoform X2 [Silurus meridionalis]KAF7686188.1 hypothetical protein HF521_015550 [Silurus meridionalis]
MSDNSTGSSGSSINSWTLLSPEEAAIDTAGPVDDGTESIGDVPSITEEVAEGTFEVKPSESEAPQETVLSEEGHQVCQGTSPELFGEGAASGPSAEDDPEICAPVIHATITTSPPDNDLLGAVPFSIATESSLFLSQEPFLEAYYEEACLIPEAVAEETPECVTNIGPASKPTAEIGPAFQPLSDIGPASAPVAEIGPASASGTEIFPISEPIQEIGPASEPVTEIDPVVKPTIITDPSSAPIAEMFPVPEPIDETDPALEPKFKISPSPEPPRSSFPDVTADVLDISHTSAIPGLDIRPDISSSSLSSEITHSPAAENPYPETPASSVLEEKDLVTDRDEHKSTYVARQAEPVGTDEPIEHGGEDSGMRQRRVHHPEEPRQSSDEEDVEEMEFRLPERKEEKPGLSMNHLIIGALALLCLGAFLISDDFDGTELSDQELLEKLVEENKQISILEAQIQAQKEELDRALRAAAEKGITDKEHARMKEELSALPGLKEELQALKARVSELTQLTAGEGQSPAGPARLWGNNDELKRQKLLLEHSKTRLETMKKQDWPKKWLGERLVEMQQRLSDQVDHISKKDEWRRKHKGAETREKGWSDGVQKHKEFLKKYRDEWEQTKPERKVERERRKQERSLQARSDHKQKHDHRADQHFESKDFWKLQEKKLRKKRNPPRHCQGMSSCADAEGLVHVKLSAFQGLLDTYLNKLQGLGAENKEAFHRLVGQFFHNGIFRHNKMLFSEFAKNMADILEDLADLLMDDDVLEEEMEEFEREVLWHFAI